MPFTKDDPNINRKGRPPTGNAWAELLRAVGEEIEPKTGKPFKELVSKRIWIECVNGNVNAMRELFNRMEGLPKQSVELSGDAENPIRVDITAILKKVYGSRNTNTPGAVLKNSK